MAGAGSVPSSKPAGLWHRPVGPAPLARVPRAALFRRTERSGAAEWFLPLLRQKHERRFFPPSLREPSRAPGDRAPGGLHTRAGPHQVGLPVSSPLAMAVAGFLPQLWVLLGSLPWKAASLCLPAAPASWGQGSARDIISLMDPRRVVACSACFHSLSDGVTASPDSLGRTLEVRRYFLM